LGGQQATLTLAHAGNGYILRIQGRAAMRHSVVVRHTAEHVIGDEHRPLVLDLSGCTHADSTFLGDLIGLNKEYGTGEPPRLSIAAPSKACMEAFVVNHLDTMLHISDRAPEASDAGVTLAVPEVPLRELGEHVLHAHENLAEENVPNAKAYRAIVERIARALKKEQE
jgi:anti-anti-sigma regulatory factor